MAETISRSEYGVTADGQPIECFRLRNSCDTTVDIITYGCRVTSWRCADRDGDFADIVLGYDNLAAYEACGICMGGVPGRYANRIAQGAFTLDGKAYSLERNNNGHHLHGGSQGFHHRVWRAHVEEGGLPVLVLSYASPDGEGGYPGNVDVSVSYSLNEDNALVIDYTAVTDQPTVINLTNHSYFNLRGHQYAGDNGIIDHQLQLHANEVLEVTDSAIPTGRRLPVADSAFDFRNRRPIGQYLKDSEEHQKLYDHCYVLSQSSQAAVLYDPVSGRCLTTDTSMPGMQLYSAGFVSNCAGKDGCVYERRGSVCLETQLFPDAPNQPDFPDTVVKPGDTWQQRTVYTISALPAGQV